MAGCERRLSVETLNLLASVGSYTTCSMGMMICNKLAVRAFPLACLLVAIQMGFSVIVMLVFCWSTLHFGSFRDVVRWCAVIPFFVGMLVTSLLALKNAPMSLVITFRALVPWVTLVIEQFFPNPTRIGLRSLGAMLLMLIGALLYALHMDRSDEKSVWAIGWVALNGIFACIDRMLSRLMLGSDQYPVDISKSGITLSNNLFGMLPLLALALILHEPAHFAVVASNMGMIDWMWVLFSCIISVGISYTGIWVQSLMSATSMLVLNNANKFVVIMIEVFAMPYEAHLTQMQVAGALLTIIATGLYAKAHDWEEAAKENVEEKVPLVSGKSNMC